MQRRVGLAFALALAGCVADDGTAMPMPDPMMPDTISYRRDIQPVWDRWCTRCHNFHTPHLTKAESAQQLANGITRFPCLTDGERARFVVPGNAERSFLYYKLTLENPQHYVGDRCDRAMPPDSSGSDVPLVQLDPDAVAMIRAWIDAGAHFD